MLVSDFARLPLFRGTICRSDSVSVIFCRAWITATERDFRVLFYV